MIIGRGLRYSFPGPVIFIRLNPSPLNTFPTDHPA